MNATLNSQREYYSPGINKSQFISENQSLCLVLGSCISTVFIGKKDNYVLAANHIVIADPGPDSIIGKRSAKELVDEILHKFREEYSIDPEDIFCFHLIGAGRQVSGDSFLIHENNIKESENILRSKGFKVLFNDTNSHFSAIYSLREDNLSVFIKNLSQKIHVSFIMDLNKLFEMNTDVMPFIPASAMTPNNEGFEKFIENHAIISITGSKTRNHDALYF